MTPTLTLLALLAADDPAAPVEADLVLRGGTVHDGTGQPDDPALPQDERDDLGAPRPEGPADPELRRPAGDAQQADQEEVSLNQYLVYLLAQRSAEGYSVRRVAPEDLDRQRSAYASLLAKLGSASYSEVRAVLAERRPAEPETGLTPDVLERLRRRIEARQTPSDQEPS